MSGERADKQAKRRHSLRFDLLFGLNAAVVLSLAAFMAWEYHNEWQTHLREKRTALEDEAQTLLPGVLGRKDNLELVQRYIDDVCSRMEDRTSPGHHIAAKVEDEILQARTHHRESEEMVRAMRTAAGRPDGLAESDGGQLVVGQASAGGTSVFVSEYVSNIRKILRVQLARRLFSIIILGAILALIVTLLIHRMVTRPLAAIIGAVRKLSGGQLGTQVPSTGPRELGFLADEFNSMSAALAKADDERRDQMEKARKIQEHLKPTPLMCEGLSIAHIYRPATDVAGDYFDVIRQGNDYVVFCVADVTGHGVPAAIEAAMLKTLFGSAARETSDPAGILNIIHDGFVPVSLDEDFATMIVAVMNCDNGRFRYASAGHEPCYLLRGDGSIVTLESTGPLLGVRSMQGWEAKDLSVSPGDRLVMLTDGVSEAASPAGELLGHERLLSIVSENGARPLDELASRIVDTATAHRDGGPQVDDVTVVLVEL